MSDLQARLLEAFKIECPEHLLGIRRSLRALEAGADSDENFYDILRHAHTLKGAARAAGVRRLPPFETLYRNPLDPQRLL